MKSVFVILCLFFGAPVIFAQSIVVRPIEIISSETADSLYGGAVIVGRGSWEKVASIVPEDTNYFLNFRAYVTTEGLFLNNLEKINESKVWHGSSLPEKSELGMDVKRQLTLTEILETSKCHQGRILIIFGIQGNVIGQEMFCEDVVTRSSALLDKELAQVCLDAGKRKIAAQAKSWGCQINVEEIFVNEIDNRIFNPSKYIWYEVAEPCNGYESLVAMVQYYGGRCF